jgi:hypothetical protein
MTQFIALTPQQQTALLNELTDTGPEDEALRAAIAEGTLLVTQGLLGLLREMAAADDATWGPLYRAACATILDNSPPLPPT